MRKKVQTELSVYQMPPRGAEGGNWNAQHSLRQQMMRKFTEFITG